MKQKWPIIYFFSNDFRLKSPVIQKPFPTKTATYLDRSMRHVDHKIGRRVELLCFPQGQVLGGGHTAHLTKKIDEQWDC